MKQRNKQKRKEKRKIKGSQSSTKDQRTYSQVVETTQWSTVKAALRFVRMSVKEFVQKSKTVT